MKRIYRKPLLFLQGAVLLSILLSSCATAGLAHYRGVGRIKRYDLASQDLPPAFDGFRVAFASDFHYESKFTRKRLESAVAALQSLNADVLLLGGDYIGANGSNMDTLFSALSHIKTEYGTFGVMGNHEYARAYKIVSDAMKTHGVRLMEHTTYPLVRGKDTIFVSGVRNPFDLKQNGVSPVASLPKRDFIILVSHTPDYVEDADISNVDLTLAGHTHGGQISLFKSWSPTHFSKYGKRFMTGIKKSSQGIPVIITNGLGTSRKKIRFCTPSEVVLIVLHCKK